MSQRLCASAQCIVLQRSQNVICNRKRSRRYFNAIKFQWSLRLINTPRSGIVFSLVTDIYYLSEAYIRVGSLCLKHGIFHQKHLTARHSIMREHVEIISQLAKIDGRIYKRPTGLEVVCKQFTYTKELIGGVVSTYGEEWQPHSNILRNAARNLTAPR